MSKFNVFLKQTVLRLLPDKQYLKLFYQFKFHKKLDLNNPVTYPEKLQWLKLYDRNPLYTTMVDKYKAKQFVADKIGENHIVPLLGVWDNFDKIDFDKLPNQFVLKTNHGCGGIVICTDKSKLDIKEARKTISKALKENYFYRSREWPYKNVEKKVFAEAYMVDESGYELKDYKFYCFNGIPKYVLVASERNKSVKFDYFDIKFNHVNIRPEDNATVLPNKPANFEEMVELSKILSQDIPFVRVDFYNCNGNIYFGELTFFDSGGFEDKREWDKIFGDMIDLSKAYCYKNN